MLAAQSIESQPFDLTDVAELAVGAVCAIGFVLWLTKSGRWRNPLAGLESTGGGPGLIPLALVLLLYVILAGVLMQLVPGGARAAPGSNEWSVLQNADSLAKLVAAIAALVVLRLRPSFPPRAHLPWWRVALTGLIAALILLPLCDVQLQAVVIVWKWLNPAWEPTLHPVLAALKAGTLSNWDKAALFVGATLATPIAEETFFRGLLLQALWRYTRHAWVSIVLSALAFGLMHASQDQLALCTMGVILGYLRLRTRSLTVCIIAHGLFNARTMVAALLFPDSIGLP